MNTPPGSITVVVVDDHEVVRCGIADLLEQEADLRVVGEAGSVAEAADRIRALRPRVAVLDVRLPDGSGVELCRDLRSDLPDLRCLMLSSYSDEQAMLDALLAGASGYVIKNIKGMDLVSAIRAVGSGARLLDERDKDALISRVRSANRQKDPLADLTSQERVLLGHIARGLTNRQIAEEMFLSEKTVKNYVSRLLTKLGVQRRTQAARLVTELLGPPRH